MSNVNNTNAIREEFPYIDRLPARERLWLRTFFRADHYGSFTYWAMLGVAAAKAEMLVSDTNDRRNLFRSDVFWEAREKISSSDLPEITKVVNRKTKQLSNDTHEDIIDIKRSIQRTKFVGYGDATNLMPGDRVLLCIEGHHFQGRIGTVVCARRGEWCIRFDTWRSERYGRTYDGVCGYFRASELSTAQQQRVAA